MRFTPTLIALTAFTVSGCTMGPDFQPPEAQLPQAKFDTHASAGAAAQPVADAWWTLFGDAELTRLEGRVVSANLDVQVAALHLSEARSQAGIAGAAGGQRQCQCDA